MDKLEQKFRIKEPGSWGFWLLVAVLMGLCVPYLFVSFPAASDARLLGIPVWFYLSVAAAITITVASVRRILKHWDIENRLP